MDHFEEVRSLDLPPGTYLVAGGSCLDVHGLRTSNDIDIIVTPETFDLLRRRGWEIDQAFEEKWSRARLKRGHFEIYTELSNEDGTYTPAEAVIPTAELIEGIAFMPLTELIHWKRINGRQKDLDDIVLIENYLNTL